MLTPVGGARRRAAGAARGVLERGYERAVRRRRRSSWRRSCSATPARTRSTRRSAPGDRLAMLLERIDELSLRHHDFGGSANALLGGFVRRIDRLKAELVEAEDYARWAAGLPDQPTRRSSASSPRSTARTSGCCAEAGARDEGDLVLRRAAAAASGRPRGRGRFEHVLIDDAQELDLAAAPLARALGGRRSSPSPATRCRRCGASAARARRGCGASRTGGARRGRVARRHRCAVRRRALAARVASAIAPVANALGPSAGGARRVLALRQRARAGAVGRRRDRAADRARGGRAGRDRGARPGDRARGAGGRGGARGAGGAAPPRRRGGVLPARRDPRRAGLAAAARRPVRRRRRSCARWRAPPIELRSVDIARCTQIARRRKLDMVAALAAATESPQVPPEARERIRVFLKLYRAGVGGDRHDPPRPLRAPADRAARAAPPAAVRRPGRRRRAAAGAGPVRRARGGLRRAARRRRRRGSSPGRSPPSPTAGCASEEEPELLGRRRSCRC